MGNFINDEQFSNMDIISVKPDGKLKLCGNSNNDEQSLNKLLLPLPSKREHCINVKSGGNFVNERQFSNIDDIS